MTKELIIIALIILLIYYYYQQNQPNFALDKVGYDNLIRDLKRQVQHYQKLYQDRVAKDIGSIKESQSIEIQTDNFIENKETQTPPILKYSRDTQTDLKDNQIQTLIGQWNQVASWAKEVGIDTNQKWNLGSLKKKLDQQLEKIKQNNQDLQEENISLKDKTVELTKKSEELNKLQTDNQLKIQEVNKLSLEKQENLTQIKEKNKELSGKQKTIQGLTLLADKRKIDSNILSERLKKELEQEKQALINLAKQKIQNKKQATELLEQLENKWQLEKVQLNKDWNTEKENLLNEWQTEKEKLETNIQQLKTTNNQKESEFQNLVSERDQLKLDIQQIQKKIEECGGQIKLNASVCDLLFVEFDKEGISSDLEKQANKIKEEIKQVANNKEICESMCKDLDNFVSFVKKRWELEKKLVSKDQQITEIKTELTKNLDNMTEKAEMIKQLEEKVKKLEEKKKKIGKKDSFVNTYQSEEKSEKRWEETPNRRDYEIEESKKNPQSAQKWKAEVEKNKETLENFYYWLLKTGKIQEQAGKIYLSNEQDYPFLANTKFFTIQWLKENGSKYYYHQEIKSFTKMIGTPKHLEDGVASDYDKLLWEYSIEREREREMKIVGRQVDEKNKDKEIKLLQEQLADKTQRLIQTSSKKEELRKELRTKDSEIENLKKKLEKK